LEVNETRPIGRIHEYGVLLAESENTEIEEGMPQSEWVSAAAWSLGGTIKEVPFDDGMHIPIAEGRRRPGLESEAAYPTAHVKILTNLLRYRNRVGDEGVTGFDRIEVEHAGVS